MSSSLKVPHIQQKADGFCLPACVQMVLAFWGIQQDQDKIAGELGTIPDVGTPGSRLRRLQSSLLKVTYGEGSLLDLQNALMSGIPPVVLVYTGELSYWNKAFTHAIVVTEIASGFVVVNDPARKEASIKTPLADFQLAWDEMANLYGLLQRKSE